MSYNLYYPEGCWVLAFVLLPLNATEKEVSALESSIPALGEKYANEWFHVKSYSHLANLLKTGSRAFPKAIVASALSCKINLPAGYIPMPLKDRKVIVQIAKEYSEAEKKHAKLIADRKAEVAKANFPNALGPAYNTHYRGIKRA